MLETPQAGDGRAWPHVPVCFTGSNATTSSQRAAHVLGSKPKAQDRLATWRDFQQKLVLLSKVTPEVGTRE